MRLVVFLLSGLMLASCGLATAAGETRPFYMGFSTWNFGPEKKDIEKTYELISKHGDFIGTQFNDGIPWPEAYEGKPYAAGFESQIRERVAAIEAIRKGKKVYLEIASLNMGRDDYCGYRGASGGMPMPEPWDTYAIDSEQKITAYANFCNDVIERFKPDFVNYGLESSDLALKKPDAEWDAFVRFHAGVYKKIKEKHPDLPLGISVPLKHPAFDEMKKLHQAVPKILPYVDFLGASVYAFVFFGHPDAGNPANLPETWLSGIAKMAQGKPVAVTETNWIAEDLEIARWNIDVKSNAEWQRAYVEKLLGEAKDLNALFVVWWSVADFDKLWNTFPENVKDIGKIWRDTGLYDENLEARPGLKVWDSWLARPVKR